MKRFLIHAITLHGILIAALFPTLALAADISVSLDRPDPFEPAYGRVLIEAVVSSPEPIERVAFYVDGVVVGEVQEPPYRFEADLGEAIGAHRFQAVAYGVSGATGTGSVVTPPLRIDDRVRVSLQQLYVTVSRDGERVLDLEAEDFKIFDARRAQELVTFARGDIPFTAVALLDASISMEGEKLRAALEGAEAFFRGMRPLDEAKLLVISDRILHATPFTTFPEVLTAGLDRIRAQGGTAIHDHLYLALRQLEERQGRRVVLLLSDGVDSDSVLAMRDVQALARRSQALIYWLRLPYGAGSGAGDALPRLTNAWRSSEEFLGEVALLEATVAASGGRIVPLGDVGEIATAFQGILGELRDQYVLGYYPSGARQDGRWREVEVEVSRRDLDVRSRGGYIDR